MDKTVMDKLVSRFLTWPLPYSVCADPIAMVQGDPLRSGTNLLTSNEARQMIEHLLEGFEIVPK